MSQIIENSRTETLLYGVAPLRPIGLLEVDILQKVTAKIIDRVAQLIEVSQAPLITYGFVTPYKGTPGVVGMGRNSFPTLIANSVTSGVTWGVVHPLFIVPHKDDKALVLEGIKRYKRKLPQNFQAFTISFLDMPFVKKELTNHFTDLQEFWYSEALIHLLAYELFEIPIPSSQKSDIKDQKVFTQWHKRGMDPEKRQKIAPNNYFSSWSSVLSQKPFFEPLCCEIANKIKLFLENQ